MVYKTIIFTFTLFCMAVSSTNLDERKKEDGNLTFEDLAIKYVGAVEEHYVTTADGYILKIFRIPGNRTRPLLLLHGLLCSSNEFIMRGNYSFAATLANAGYDVWFLNFRGNRYSRRHVKLDPDTDSSFWEFGSHQYGYYDLATGIDFVLSKTEERKLSLIGHSQGTLTTYILGSERPEYNSKIKVLIALAPVAYIHYIETKLPNIKRFGYTVRSFMQSTKVMEVGGYDSISGAMIRKFCSHNVGIEVCRRILLIAFHFKAEISEDIAYVFRNIPAGTSRMNLEHVFQMILNKRFANYDYGPMKNLLKYKSEIAPEYDLRKVTMRIHMIGAKSDILAVLEDVKQQYRELPNVAECMVIEDELFSHMDFVWSRKAKQMVHPKVLEILRKYN